MPVNQGHSRVLDPTADAGKAQRLQRLVGWRRGEVRSGFLGYDMVFYQDGLSPGPPARGP